ncbi:hypothetical protein MBLNU459_g5842t1 [Dothideomycetes sp. NU459]
MSDFNRLLCWTVCGYRKEGMSEDAYHKYLSDVHGPLVRSLLVKHGFHSYSLVHTDTSTRANMDKIFDPQFANVADYDCIIQATFDNVDDFVKFKADPEFLEKIAPDHENFADTKRSRMTIGWVQDHVKEGKVVNDF